MDFQDVLKSRYSARRFLSQPIPEQTLERLLELAQYTPSWCNTQPWQLVITRGEATDRFRQALYQHARSGAKPEPDFAFPAAYLGAYRDRRKLCGVQLYQALGIGREDKSAAAEQSLENFRFFGAPHVAIVTTDDSLGAYGMLDCGLYIQTFMLAARDLGIGSIAQAALASYPAFIRQFFGLPADRKLVCGISFGFADEAHAIHSYRTERAPLTDVVRYLEG
jgi:nitroreductase